MYNFLLGANNNSFSVLILNNTIQFFYVNRKCGEILNLNNFAYYVKNRFLVIEDSNLNFILKFYKNCPLSMEFKIKNKDMLMIKEDNFYLYYKFKNINKIELKIGKVFELNEKGRETAELLFKTELKKPLLEKQFDKVLCGYEVKNSKDYEMLFNLRLLSKVFKHCERNYKIEPIFLENNTNKNKINKIKYNYLILKNKDSEIKKDINYDTAVMFEMPLVHSIFKLKKESTCKIWVFNNDVSFNIETSGKILDYYIEYNVLRIIYKKTEDLKLAKITPSLERVPLELKFKAIYAIQNDFFGLLRALENKKIKFDDKLLNKLLESIKWHIKNKTDRNYLSKKVISLCGYVETAKQKRGLMRLSGLINKMPKSDSMLTRFLKNEDIYKVNFNEPEYLEILALQKPSKAN